MPLQLQQIMSSWILLCAQRHCNAGKGLDLNHNATVYKDFIYNCVFQFGQGPHECDDQRA